jgi:hypothetical protein
MQGLPVERARDLARALAVGRIVIGVTALVVPWPIIRLWVGRGQDRRAVNMFARIVGGREVALGLGALLALGNDAPVRGWMEAASLADAVDCTVTATRFRSLPRFSRWLFLLGAASAASAEAVAARTVDAGSDS